MATSSVSERASGLMASGNTNSVKILEGIPPHDESAEVGVLGSMLMDARAADIAIEELKESDFYLPRHRLLFSVICTLFQKQEKLDEVYIKGELTRRGLLEAVGGEEIFDRLILETPSPANVEAYCRLVRDRAIERELIDGAGKILKMVHEPSSEDSESLVEAAEKIVYDITDKRTSEDAIPIVQLMNSALREAELVQVARREGREIESPALPTEFVELDRLLSGGFWPGELIVIAGRPSMGKTTFAINIVRQVSVGNEKHVRPTAIFSLEMPKEQVAKNILCAQAEIPGYKMRRYEFSEKEYEKVQFFGKVLQQAPIYIDDTSALSISALRARCRRLRHRHDVRLVVVDYLQLMRGPANRRDSREQEVAEISRSLKSIARDLKIPLVVLSQLNRSAEKRENDDKRPQLSDLRESGAIEQDADVVIMLYRAEYYDLEQNAKNINVGEALILKNRNGPVGQVKLTFHKDILRFSSHVPDHEAVAGA